MSLVALATTVVGTATASQRSAPASGICDLVSPAGTAGGGNVPVDEGAVIQMRDALQQASSLSLPKAVKKAVKTLLPLYEKLASGKGDTALAKLAAFVDKECGASAGAEGGKNAGAVDPCDVLTLEDAATLAGTPVDAGVSLGAENATRSCSYNTPVTGPTAQVEFYIGPGAKKSLDIDRQLSHAFTPVADLGAEAYVELGNIFWQQRGTWYWIRLVRLDAAGQETAPLETLAREVAGRL